jgi:hypothetical protein
MISKKWVTYRVRICACLLLGGDCGGDARDTQKPAHQPSFSHTAGKVKAILKAAGLDWIGEV